MTCVDSNLSCRDIHIVQKNVNKKNIIQKIYEREEQTYNCVIYLLWFEHEIKIKERRNLKIEYPKKKDKIA